MTKNDNKKKKAGSNRNLFVIGGIAVVVVIVLIWAGLGSDTVPEGYSGPDPSIPRGYTEDGRPYLGDPDAPLTLLMYEDFACSNCQKFFSSVEPFLVEEYIETGKVKLVIYTLAYIDRLQSLPSAEAAACAAEQDKFWEYRHLLYANQGRLPFTRNNLITLAKATKLDIGAFSDCYDQGTHRADIIDKTISAQQFGVEGTPTLEINGKRYPGLRPFDSDNEENLGLKQIIEGALLESQE